MIPRTTAHAYLTVMMYSTAYKTNFQVSLSLDVLSQLWVSLTILLINTFCITFIEQEHNSRERDRSFDRKHDRDHTRDRDRDRDRDIDRDKCRSDREGDDGRGAYGAYDRGRDVQKSVIISQVFSPPFLLVCPVRFLLLCHCN